MVDIVLDGIWCRECRDTHPTLMWHVPYSEYVTKEKRKEDYKDAAKRFGIRPEEIDRLVSDAEKYQRYKETNNLEKCVICGTETVFINKATGHHVCRDGCLYKDSELQEAEGRS